MVSLIKRLLIYQQKCLINEEFIDYSFLKEELKTNKKFEHEIYKGIRNYNYNISDYIDLVISLKQKYAGTAEILIQSR